MIDVRLIDRDAERQVLGQVLDDVREGKSGALVLRGEPGVGKSALLGYAVDPRRRHAGRPGRWRVESEKHLGFAAVHQLLVPFLPAVDRLPEPQRRALQRGLRTGVRAAGRSVPGRPGGADAAVGRGRDPARPVRHRRRAVAGRGVEPTCSAFVARRLLADRVGMLFAVRETADADPLLQALPELSISGLPEQAAYELHPESMSRPIDPVWRRASSPRPGAIRSPSWRPHASCRRRSWSGRVPLPEPLPVGHQLERVLRAAGAGAARGHAVAAAAGGGGIPGPG